MSDTTPNLSSRAIKVLSDLSSGIVSAAASWFYNHNEQPGAFPARYGCHVTPYVCGLETLPEVRTLIREAKQSVEISLWGFDPSVSVYGYSPEEHQNCGPVARIFSKDHKIGNILYYAGQRDLKIKMLLWDLGEIASNVYRLVDYLEAAEERISVNTLLERERKRHNGEKQTAPPAQEGSVRYLMEVPNLAINWDWVFNSFVFPELSPLLPSLEKEDWLVIRDNIIAPMKYRYTWFKNVEEKKLYFHNIEKRLTATAPEDLVLFLVQELRVLHSEIGMSGIMLLLMMPELVKQFALEWFQKKAEQFGGGPAFMRISFPTHHQKIILADYENVKKARAFVMGNNIRETDVDAFPQPFTRPREGGRYPGPFEFLADIDKSRLRQDLRPIFSKIVNKMLSRDFLRKVELSGLAAMLASGAILKAGQLLPGGSGNFFQQSAQALQKVKQTAQEAIQEAERRFDNYVPPPMAPRQDIACSVRGPVLYDINKQFMENWIKAGGTGFRKNQSIKPEDFALPVNLSLGTSQFSVTRLRDNKLGPIFKAYETALKNSTKYVYLENQYFRSQDIAEKLLECAQARKDNRSHEHGEPLYYFAVINAVDKYAIGTTYNAMQTLGHEEQMPKENRKQLLRERKKLLNEGVPASDERILDLNRRIDRADTLAHNLRNGGKAAESSSSPGNIENPEDAFGMRQAHEFLKGHIGTMMVCRPVRVRVENKFVKRYVYKDVNIHSKLLLADDVFAIIGSANMHDRGLMSDAESVIGSTQVGLASGLRKKLFANLLGKPRYASEDYIPPVAMYDDWKNVMDNNWEARHNREPLTGTLNYLYVYDYKRWPDMD